MTSPEYFYTWSAQGSAQGIAITGGAGSHFECADGSKWLDLGSLSYQASLGHGHPEIVAAIQKQASELCLAPPNAEFAAKTELAKKLLALAPQGYSKVFFTLGGSEANENAMKMARLVTGRLKFISRYRSYHGATMGALALTGDYRRPPLEPVLGNVIHVLGEDPAYLEEVMDLEGDKSIAAVVMEPIPGANGVLLPRDDYWPRMRAACDKHGALLIADEVLTGFGRTGRCFGFEHYGVEPDMITVAKALTGGYAALGAVLVHERVAAHFETEVLFAGLTNYAHPLGCAAGLAALQIYESQALYTRAAHLAPTLLDPLRALCDADPSHFSGARGRGMLAAVDVAGTPAYWTKLHRAVDDQKIFLHLSETRGTAIFAPPLNIEEALLGRGMQAFADAAAVASADGGGSE
jgi:taurine--2-oxoglutarate transaminase